MPTTTLTSREFHQDSGKVKRAAQNGPVIITDRGKPVLVVQRAEDFTPASEKSSKFVSLADALGHSESAHIDFDIPEIRDFPKDINLY
jgi:prevent-host-death family protein